MTKEELEKEAEELYEDWYAHKLGAISIIGVICKMAESRENRIVELEKENAELKEKYVKKITDCDICDTYCNSQLIKAKEIIKSFITLLTKSRTALDTKTCLTKAEQFLRETDIDNAIQKANEGLNLDKIAEKIEQDIKEQSNS